MLDPNEEIYVNVELSDVAVLYEIITTAQESDIINTQPFRAIIPAYDKILAQNGLDPNHDQVYLRFLLKLGGKRKAGQSLFETFTAFLAELGIELVVDAEEDSPGDVEQSGVGTAEVTTSPKDLNVSRGRSRRASFGFTREIEEDTRVSQARGDSRSSVSRLQSRTRAVPDDRPSTRATTRPTERTHSRIANPVTNFPRPDRGRLSTAQFGNSLQHGRRRRASASSHGSHEVGQSGRSTNWSAISTQDDGLSALGSSSGIDEENRHSVAQGAPTTHLPVPSELLYRPSVTQLLRDADTFRQYHVRSVALNIIERWRASAFRLQGDHDEMTGQAVARDRDVLFRQAFDQWRVAYVTRRQAAETERFFNHLDHRAGRARDLYLLTKAFTHWAQCTSEEVERTSLARRHILRTRYFNAWQEITAVNDLKVRRQGLRKFFPLWHRRHHTALEAKKKAMLIYQGDLVQSVYWRWFWSFCERRAPVWRNARLKRGLFLLWKYRTTDHVQRDEAALVLRNKERQKQCILFWHEKVQQPLLNNGQTEVVRRQKLLRNHWSVWQMQSQYLPLIRRISSMIDWRVARSAFSMLLDKYTLEGHATMVNRLRLLRNTWTHWNDRLRWQTLARQIDDRCATQALYKWVLAERYLLLRRLYEKRLKNKLFVKLVQSLRRLDRRNNRNCRLIEEARDRQSLTTALQQWCSQIRTRRQQEHLAHEYFSPRVLQDTLTLWRARCSHMLKLEEGVKDAVFYLRTTRALRKWQEAVAESRKQKRRAAYMRIRRLVKVNLARRVINRLHNLTIRISTLEQIAGDKNSERLFAIATARFDQWREVFTTLNDKNNERTAQYTENLVRISLQTWLSQYQSYQQAADQASEFHYLHTSKIAYESLRALRIKVFEVRSRNEKAVSFQQWNEQRRFRNFLRLWREETAQKRGQPSPTDQLRTARSRRFVTRPGSEVAAATTMRGDAGTTFGEDFELDSWTPALEPHQAYDTPLPRSGAFTTPSKRAARARALVRVPMTPATPVVSAITPFGQRLRLVRTDSRYSRSTDLARSSTGGGLGTGDEANGFEDIPEVSSSVPGTQ